MAGDKKADLQGLAALVHMRKSTKSCLTTIRRFSSPGENESALHDQRLYRKEPVQGIEPDDGSVPLIVERESGLTICSIGTVANSHRVSLRAGIGEAAQRPDRAGGDEMETTRA